MTIPQNFSLRTVANYPPNILRGILRCLKFLLSIPTFCDHYNRNYTTPWTQSCWKCGRLRTYSAGRWCIWHRAGKVR
jgi:hypothetical protein